jgi:type I restriction enzyme S subunit
MSFEAHLGDIAEIIMGQSPKKEDVNESENGFPLLNGPTEFSSKSPIPVQFTTNGKKFSKHGDILFCVRGSTTGRMNYADQKYAIGRGIAAIRGKEGYPTPYIRALLEHNLPRLLTAATGSTFPNVGKDLINSFVIEAVNPQTAQEINQIIVSLDDKIELNRQINQTLEEMAQAIFKSWFVDFEPVKAKIQALENGSTEEDANLAAMVAISGKTTQQLQTLKIQSPKDYQQLYQTAQHFPAAMQVSERGEIPVGWEIKQFGDYLETISKTFPLKEVDEVVFLNTGDIQDGRFLHENFVSTEGLPGQAKKSIQKHDILYSEIRPINRRFAYVSFDVDHYVVSTKLMVLRTRGRIPSEVLYFLLTRQSIIDELQIAAESRSGTFPQIRFENISKTEFIGPSDDKLFWHFSASYLKKYYIFLESIKSENTQLETTRNTILPKLLSGYFNLSGVKK